MNKELKCPLCGSNLKKGKKVYYCEKWNIDEEARECNFTLPVIFKDTDISEEDMERLCNGELTEVKKMHSKEGSDFYASLRYDADNNKLEFVFKKNGETKAICPQCGEHISEIHKEGKTYYACKNKHFFQSRVLAGHVINESELDTLMQMGKLGPIGDFVSKDGKTFKANLVLEEDESGKFYVKFQFPERAGKNR